MTTKTLTHNSVAEVTDLLVGRRIVWTQLGQFDYPGRSSWGDKADGKIILDDGTELFVVPNEGCGGCSNGRYYSTALALCDNVITSVKLAASDETYRIFVYADNVEINAVQIDGSDGSGCYGSGYELVVVFPESDGLDKPTQVW
jgi:hypothetical protein